MSVGMNRIEMLENYPLYKCYTILLKDWRSKRIEQCSTDKNDFS